MTEWQPIETAPVGTREDPKRLVLWVSDGGLDGTGTASLGDVTLDHRGTRMVRAEGFMGNWKITHYVLLPEPPQ